HPSGKFNYVWQGFTWSNWRYWDGVPGIRSAIFLSLEIALLASLVATVLGTAIALALVRYGFRGRAATNILIFLPPSTPEVRLGDDVPAVRLGRRAHRRAAAGQRHRHGDLRRRRDRDARERARADAAAAIRGERLSVEPRLPPWWWDEAGHDEPAPALAGDTSADVCVVGGGYTGLWTALALKEREPSARVVLLEAGTCGSGPSGRNGGFLHGYWASLASLVPLLGPEEALALARAGERVIPAVRALPDDVWLREGGMLMLSAAPSQHRAVENAVAAAAKLDVPEQAVPLDRAQIAARVRSPVFRRGVVFPDGASVPPA